MKTRIFSFFLALVMLFSCLSLTVFAAEALSEEKRLEKAFESAGIGLPGNNNLAASEIAALFESVGAESAYTKFSASNKGRHISKNGTLSTANAPAFLSSSSEYMDFVLTVHESEGGTFACGNTFETYLQFTNSNYSSYTKAVSAPDNVRGKDSVLSFDFEFCETYALGQEVLFQYRTYLAHQKNGTTMATLDVEPLSINNDGQLLLKDGTVIAELKGKTGYTNIAVHFFPEKNTLDIYIDGARKAHGIQMFTTEQIDRLTFKEGTEYKDGDGNVMSFADLPKGNADFLPGVVRFIHSSTKYHDDECGHSTTAAFLNIEGDQYKFTNAIWYNSSTYIGCAHNWTYSHSHDANSTSSELTATCQWCGKTESSKSFNDYSVLTGTGNLMTPEELKTSGIAYRAATELDTSTDTVVLKDNGTISKLEYKKDETTGNGYIRYYNPTYAADYEGTKDTATSYLQIPVTNISRYNSLNDFWNFRGKNITYSFDFLYSDGLAAYADGTNLELFQLVTYLKSSTSDYEDGVRTTSTIAVEPLYINNAGVLTRGTQNGNDITYELVKDNWYNILIYHDVKNNTFDIFVNGECIWNDVTALGTDKQKYLKWTYTEGDTFKNVSDASGFINGITTTNEEGKKTYTLTPEDFYPTTVRTGQFSCKSDETLLAYDNFKIYLSETNIECTHKCTASNVCDLCGVTLKVNNACDACGYFLADGVSVLNRNVTLGDKIGMNLYLTLSESVRNTEGAAVVVSVGGKQTLQLPVNKLTPEADGTYKVTALLRSIDMTKDVTVEVTGIESLGTYTTSVYEYLKALDKKSTDATEKALIVAMKNYGAYAQEYFAEKNDTETGVLANLDLLTYVKKVNNTTSPVKSENKITVTGSASGVAITGATLILTSETKMKFFFTAEQVPEVIVNTKAADVHKEGDEYYVVLSCITPAAFENDFEIVINNQVTAKVSILSAIDAIFANKDSSDAFRSLAGAMYNYYAAACAYAENQGGQ